LSPSLATNGDVTSMELDPSGSVAEFLADARVDGRAELFRVPVDGSESARRLSGALPASGDVREFALTPDGASVVYCADEVANNRFDLFAVPLSGSAPPHGVPGGGVRPRVTRLSALTESRVVQADWRLSPDGHSVLYRADATVAGVLELLRVAVDGRTPPVTLSGPLSLAADVTAFAVAPDQSRVVYLADARADGVIEPFSAPFAGGPVVALDVLPGFADVEVFRIEPSSLALVYQADGDTDGVLELYRVPLGGGAAPVKLNLPLPVNGDVQSDFVVLPGGTVFRAERTGDQIFELFLSY